MNITLSLTLLFVNTFQGDRNIDLSEIDQQRAKSIRAAKLGRLLFDKKEYVKNIRDTAFNNIPVRIYKNSDAENQRVIVYFHGGGFCYYNIESHDYVTRRLCKMNDCTVISVDYRLAPEHVFPSAQEDAFEIVEYVYQHAAELGIDKNKIIVAGDSAGGTISACVAHHFKRHPQIKIAAQVLIYPWVDGRVDTPSIQQYQTGYMLTKAAILWLQRVYVPEEKDRLSPLAAPTHHTDFSGLAPAFIATAGFDPLKDEGFEYAEKLRKAGNEVQYKNYEKLVHGFANIPKVAPNGMSLYDDIKGFLEAHAKG
jgi:acetyl esterase